jgi:hypothetical protein
VLQASSRGEIIVRWTLACLDGSQLPEHWRAPQSASEPPQDVLLCLEVVDNGPGFGDGVDPESLFRPLYLAFIDGEASRHRRPLDVVHQTLDVARHLDSTSCSRAVISHHKTVCSR